MTTVHAQNNASQRMWRCVEDVKDAVDKMHYAFLFQRDKEAVMWGMTACGILNGRWNSVYSTFFL